MLKEGSIASNLDEPSLPVYTHHYFRDGCVERPGQTKPDRADRQTSQEASLGVFKNEKEKGASHLYNNSSAPPPPRGGI